MPLPPKQAHTVSFNPNNRTVSHRIQFDRPNTDVTLRRRDAHLAENYLRVWGENKQVPLKLTLSSLKMSLEERNLRNRQLGLISITGIWQTELSIQELEKLKSLTEKEYSKNNS